MSLDNTGDDLQPGQYMYPTQSLDVNHFCSLSSALFVWRPGKGGGEVNQGKLYPGDSFGCNLNIFKLTWFNSSASFARHKSDAGRRLRQGKAFAIFCYQTRNK